MDLFFVVLAAVALVPAPQECRETGGVFRTVIELPCSREDWWDFDVMAACLDTMKTTRTTDASLPPEGYRLKVAPTGVEIAAVDEAGAFYARQTLEQLAETVSTNAIALPCCEIRDWPKYRWRGMLIDEARHFLGKGVVKRVLDLMGFHKMNVLHWHLVDDQGWRLEIRRHPELVEYGAVRPRSVKMGANAKWLPPDKKLSYEHDTERCGPFFYTQDDVREILAYAKDRHITVVPEIELPGHVRALLAAHPELSCKGDLPRIPRIDWSTEEDVLCVGNDAALKLLEDVFDEVCGLFPDTPYIHIGGDECPRIRWKECPKCQARIRTEGLKDESGLQSWITAHFVRYLERKGRRAVGWDEILSGDVPRSAIGMTWRMSQKGGAGTSYTSAAEASARGHDMVMTPKDFCYLDYSQFASGDPYVYHVPWRLPLTLEKAYSFDPVAGIPESCRPHILGGQASAWGESIWSVFDLEWKTWPRACAIAEALWTAPSGRDFPAFRQRLLRHRERLVRRHVNVAPIKWQDDHIFAFLADCGRYENLHPLFAKAFEFLRRGDLAQLPVGRHEIDGDNCWAMVQDVRLTPLADDSMVEAHREYVDIQMPLSGPETIGVLTMNADQLSRPFDTVKDAVLFKAKTAPRTLHPGEFAVFMPPYGAHAPGHSADGDRTIRKVVIKVRAQARLTD